MSESIETKIELIESDIANAYDECEAKGAVIPQVQGSANLANTIASIQTGKPEVVAQKYVNFVDYDGTVLYAYSRSELQSMTELPPLPGRSGLTYTGWNRTLLRLTSGRIIQIRNLNLRARTETNVTPLRHVGRRPRCRGREIA